MNNEGILMEHGYYKHYKGGIYKTLQIAKHTESVDELVIYIDVKGNTWARPIEMFCGSIGGIKRFTKLSDREGMLQFRFHQVANEKKNRL